MKYAGIEVTKVTTINQPVMVAIFLVSMGGSWLTLTTSDRGVGPSGSPCAPHQGRGRDQDADTPSQLFSSSTCGRRMVVWDQPQTVGNRPHVDDPAIRRRRASPRGPLPRARPRRAPV